MSLGTKSNSESIVIDKWIRSGKPVLTQLKKHTTLMLAFGKPEAKMVQDVYDKKVMPKVEFSQINKLKMDGRYYVFPLAKNVDAGESVTRGSGGLATRTPVSTDPLDALRFQSAYYVVNYDIPNDKLDELQGAQWAIDGSFASNASDAIVRNYLDEDAAAIWATGAGVMPVDGVCGSIRGQCSDGMTNGQRGSGGNESNYALLAGYTRSDTNLDLSANYQYKSGGALTLQNLEDAADAAYSNGATKVVVPLRNTRFRKLADTIRTTYGAHSLKVDEELEDMGVESGFQFQIGAITCYIDFDIPVGTWVTTLNLPALYAGSDFAKMQSKILHNTQTKNSSVLHSRFKRQVMLTDPRTCTLTENLESL